jgi:Cu/Zn superoxide dismutase
VIILNKCLNAVAELKGSKEHPNLYGTVKFLQKKNFVLVKACITGLPKSESGFFGFHIHSGEDCLGEEFLGSQGHFNPTDTPTLHTQVTCLPFYYVTAALI